MYMQIMADWVIIPGDGFSYTLTMKTRKLYNRVCVTQDVTMIVIATIIIYIGLGTLGGVCKGVVISAILVGNIASLYVTKLGRFIDKVIPGKHEELMRNRSKKKKDGSADTSE